MSLSLEQTTIYEHSVHPILSNKHLHFNFQDFTFSSTGTPLHSRMNKGTYKLMFFVFVLKSDSKTPFSKAKEHKRIFPSFSTHSLDFPILTPFLVQGHP